MSSMSISGLVDHAAALSPRGIVLAQPFPASAGELALREPLFQAAACLSALANHDGGGVLLLGVRAVPPGAPGVGDVPAAWVRIQQLAREMEPPVTLQPTTVHQVDGASVILVRVASIKGQRCFHRPRGLVAGRFRIGAGSVDPWPVGPEELGALADRRSLEMPWRDEYDEAAMKRLASWSAVQPTGPSFYGEEWKRKLVTLGVFTDESCMGRPTLAGALCFAKRPSKQIPGARLLLEDRWQIRQLEGNIPMLLSHISSFSRTCTGLEASILRELVLNALVHRDWSLDAVPVQVRLGTHRVEVISPGEPLEVGLLVSNPEHRCAVRNPTLADLVWRLRLSGGRGEGLERVRAWLDREGGQQVVEVRGGETRVSLEGLGEGEPGKPKSPHRLVSRTEAEVQSVAAKVEGSVAAEEPVAAEPVAAAEAERSPDEEAVLALFASRAELTTREVIAATRWSRSKARGVLAGMVERGVLLGTADSARSPRQAYRRG